MANLGADSFAGLSRNIVFVDSYICSLFLFLAQYRWMLLSSLCHCNLKQTALNIVIDEDEDLLILLCCWQYFSSSTCRVDSLQECCFVSTNKNKNHYRVTVAIQWMLPTLILLIVYVVAGELHIFHYAKSCCCCCCRYEGRNETTKQRSTTAKLASLFFHQNHRHYNNNIAIVQVMINNNNYRCCGVLLIVFFTLRCRMTGSNVIDLLCFLFFFVLLVQKKIKDTGAH